LAEKLGENGFNSILTSSARNRVVRVAEMLVTTWLQRGAYDLAHVDVYSGAAFRWAEWVTVLLRTLKKPVVLTLHGGDLASFSRAHQRRVARLLSMADAVTTPSRYLANSVHEMRGDIEVIPNPIETSAYTYVERSHPAPKLVWLRSFHRIYDPVLAIRVLAKLTASGFDARLTMIGPDKDGSLAETRAEAIRLGVLQRVHFVGGVPKSDVPRLLAECDIFLNTSTIDNTPVSVIEAMATGLLVVSTSVGGVPYLIDSGHDGILVGRGDADAMAEAVRQYLERPGFAARVSRNARAKAEKFSWDEVLPRWEELLTRIAGTNDFRNARQAS
jgi:glycosyltransferase involved in cell wall biosynthesis